MPSFRNLIKASSGLGEGFAVRDHLNALGSGTGGLPYPVPVEMIGVENISLINAESTQITTQTANDGINKQVVSEQIDQQVTDSQITSTIGNNCK